MSSHSHVPLQQQELGSTLSKTRSIQSEFEATQWVGIVNAYRVNQLLVDYRQTDMNINSMCHHFITMLFVLRYVIAY